MIFDRDDSGHPIIRPAVAPSGWSYHLQGVDFTTSDLDSVYNKDEDGNDLGFTTIKLYDAQDAEITLEANEGNAVKTVIDWVPTFDYEIIGGRLKQHTKPASDMYLYVVGVPDIPAPNGSKAFICCVNMRFIGSNDEVNADGRAGKRLLYDNPIPNTNKMRLTVNHAAGLKHDLHIMFELFKA